MIGSITSTAVPQPMLYQPGSRALRRGRSDVRGRLVSADVLMVWNQPQLS